MIRDQNFEEYKKENQRREIVHLQEIYWKSSILNLEKILFYIILYYIIGCFSWTCIFKGNVLAFVREI